MTPLLTALMISGILALVNGAVGTGGAIINAQSQRKANEQNIEMQKATNAQNQYNLEHAHQIEMNDLEAAGLNPVLTAMGGSGSQVSNLQAPQTKPVQTDLSGVQSAIAGMQSMMSTMMMFQMMSDRMQILENNNIRTSTAYRDRTTQWKNRNNGYMNPSNAYKAGHNSMNSAQSVQNATSDQAEIEFAKKFTGINDPKKAMQELSRIAKTKWLKR